MESWAGEKDGFEGRNRSMGGKKGFGVSLVFVSKMASQCVERIWIAMVTVFSLHC